MLRPALLTLELGPELRRRIEPHVFGPLFELCARDGTTSLTITQAKELLAIALPQYREVVAGSAPALAAIGPVPLHEVGTLLHQALHEAAAAVPQAFLVSLARISRLNPRVALERAQELLTHHRFDSGAYPLDSRGLALLAREWQVDEDGLRPEDLRYLRALETGRRGLAALTQMLPVGRDEILTVIEPYLLQLELVRMTGAGRELTERGRRLLADAQGRATA